MRLFKNIGSSLSLSPSAKFSRIGKVVFFVILFSHSLQAIPLSEHIKRFTSVLSHRNLDSLRMLIDPSRIYVEIAPKTGSFLSPSQTLAVFESFFASQPAISFSYRLVKEEGKTGIAIGTLVMSESGQNITHKTSFGFQKDNRGNWTLSRITIR